MCGIAGRHLLGLAGGIVAYIVAASFLHGMRKYDQEMAAAKYLQNAVAAIKVARAALADRRVAIIAPKASRSGTALSAKRNAGPCRLFAVEGSVEKLSH